MIQEKTALTALSLAEFVKTTASSAPAPGGGSISAASGAFAAALLSMVAALTLGKDPDEAARAQLMAHQAHAEAVQCRLLAGIETDAEAFDAVMAAFRMPKSSDGEKQARSEAIQHAFRNAAQVPLDNAKAAASLLPAAEYLIQYGNPNAKSDAAVALLQLRAAVFGALHNVRINLTSIRDPQFSSAVAAEADALEQRVGKGVDALENEITF